VTTPYANTAVQTNQIPLPANTATKVGSGAAGVPLASRLLWSGMVVDTAANVQLGDSTVTLLKGFPMQAGIPELRAYGPSIDIWAISDKTTVIYVEEAS
jgi:hypothetical protein